MRRRFNQTKFNRKSLNSKYFSKDEESRGDRRKKGAKGKEERQSNPTHGKKEKTKDHSNKNTDDNSDEKFEENEISSIEEEFKEDIKRNKENFSLSQKSELFHYTKESSDEKREQPTCPICVEVLDETDRNFFPCDCGYQICLWCFNYIKDYMCNKCPACRRTYTEENFVYKGETEEKLIKKEKSTHTKKMDDELKNPYDLYKHPNYIDVDPCEGVYHAVNNIRVVQRNLVFVLGITEQFANPNILQSNEYFGKYGTILNVVANKSQNYNPAYKGPSYSAYITYNSEKEAVNAIYHIDGMLWDKKVLRASFGTTKYCSCLEQNEECTSDDCFFLHSIGNVDDSFTKDDILGPKLLYCELFRYYFNKYPENSEEIFEQYYLENYYSSDESYEQSSMESSEHDSEFDRKMEKRINEWKEEAKLKIEQGEYDDGYEEYLDSFQSGSEFLEEEDEEEEEEEIGLNANGKSEEEEKGKEGEGGKEKEKKKKKRKRRRKKKTKEGNEEDESFDERDFYSDLYGEDLDAEEYNKYEMEMFEKEYEHQMMDECDEENYEIYDKEYEKRMYGEFYDPSVLDEEYDRREFAIKYDPTLFDNKHKTEAEKNGDGTKNECKFISFYELLNQFEEREQEHSSPNDYDSASDFFFKKEDHHSRKKEKGSKNKSKEIKQETDNETGENSTLMDQNGILENNSEHTKKKQNNESTDNARSKDKRNTEVMNGVNANGEGTSKNELFDEPKGKRKKKEKKKKKKEKKNAKEGKKDSSACKGQKKDMSKENESDSDHADEINKKTGKEYDKNGAKSEKKQEKKQKKAKNESHGNVKENGKTKENKLMQKEEVTEYKSEESEESEGGNTYMKNKNTNNENELESLKRENYMTVAEDIVTNDEDDFENYSMIKENLSNDETYEHHEEKERDSTQKEPHVIDCDHGGDISNEDCKNQFDKYTLDKNYMNDKKIQEQLDIKQKDSLSTHSTVENDDDDDDDDDPYSAAYFGYISDKDETKNQEDSLKQKLETNVFAILDELAQAEINDSSVLTDESKKQPIEETDFSKDTKVLFSNLLVARWMYNNRKSLKLENDTMYVLKKKFKEDYSTGGGGVGGGDCKENDLKKKDSNTSALKTVVQVGSIPLDDDYCVYYKGDMIEVQKESGINRYTMTKDSTNKCDPKVINMETYKKFKDYMSSLANAPDYDLSDLDINYTASGDFIQMLMDASSTHVNLINELNRINRGDINEKQIDPNILKKMKQMNTEMKKLDQKINK